MCSDFVSSLIIVEKMVYLSISKKYKVKDAVSSSSVAAKEGQTGLDRTTSGGPVLSGIPILNPQTTSSPARATSGPVEVVDLENCAKKRKNNIREAAAIRSQPIQDKGSLVSKDSQLFPNLISTGVPADLISLRAIIWETDVGHLVDLGSLGR